jgi:hypothetical protein
MESDIISNIIYPEMTKAGIKTDLLLPPFQIFKLDISCIICREIANEAEQCQTCSTIFCKECIRTWLIGNYLCPARCVYRSKKLNITASNLLSKMQLKCEHGCDEILSYEDYIKHTTYNCAYVKVKCKGCLGEFLKCQINDHINLCPSVIVSCELCGKRYLREHLQNEHKKFCPEFKILCKKCSKPIKQKNWESHIEKCFEKYCSDCNKSVSMSDVTKKIEEMQKYYDKYIDTLIDQNEELEIQVKTLKNKTVIRPIKTENKILDLWIKSEWNN